LLRRNSSFACAALLGGLLTCASAFAQDEAAPAREGVSASDQAEAEFRQGARAYERGDSVLALGKMRNAFRLRPDYRTAAGLGQIELHLQRHRDAAEHLEFALRHYPKIGDPEGRARLMDGFRATRAFVGTLTLEAQSRGVTLSVDGELLATLPVSHDLFLEPGTRQIRFEVAGHAPHDERLEVQAGGAYSLQVTVGPALPHTPAKAPARATGGGWLLLTGSALSLAALGTGAILTLDASRSERSALDRRSLLAGACESDSRNPDCLDARHDLDHAHAARDWAAASFAGAAAFSLLTIGAYVWISHGSAEEEDLVWVPNLSKADARLELWGRF
jgi:tetratricopeptide (TPR) repeat protein